MTILPMYGWFCALSRKTRRRSASSVDRPPRADVHAQIGRDARQGFIGPNPHGGSKLGLRGQQQIRVYGACLSVWQPFGKGRGLLDGIDRDRPRHGGSTRAGVRTN